MSEKIHRNSLQPGHKLHWYRIEKILGQGGFGITYLAHDFNLDRQVAIKEYLPIELAVRERDFSVHPVTEDHGEKFRWGLDRFITEARTLAKFKHPNIVHVLNVFEENNTAYMVMEYEQGESLQEILSHRKTLEEAELINILIPVLGGLQMVHEAGFIHRDIKPANIFIREDGSPVLLDFGSARQALSMATQTLTSLVSPGYAPYEQYYSRSDQQGPWTDIYGLGATLYRAAAGKAPMDAVDRSRAILKGEQDIFVPASQTGKGRYSERFLLAIDHALQFKEEDRPQTISAWKSEFDLPEDPIKQAIIAEHTPTQPGTKVLEKQQQKKLLYSKVAILVVLVGIGVLYLYHGEIQDYLFGPTKTQLEAERQRVEQEKRLAVLKHKEEEDRRRREEEKSAEQERQAELERQRQEEEQKRIEAEVQRQAELERQREEEVRKLETERLAIEEERKRLQEEEQKRADAEAQRKAKLELQRAEDEKNRLAEEEVKLQSEDEILKKERIQKPFEAAIAAYKYGDYKAAIALLMPLVELGFAPAQVNLGLMYQEGKAFPRDDKQAVFWYQKAADQGDRQAQYNLGVMYEKGRGVSKDDQQAVSWYQKAAEQGLAHAQHNLGNMYFYGNGVPQDDQQAVSWYQKAADQGLAQARYFLGLMYEKGNGVPQNDQQAVSWYQKAADQGIAEAQYNLGLMYEKGKGVPKDDKQAVSWYHRAADQGLTQAQYNLGFMYRNGDGVPQDDKQAIHWFQKAAEQGHADAKHVLESRYYDSENLPQEDKQASQEPPVIPNSAYEYTPEELREIELVTNKYPNWVQTVNTEHFSGWIEEQPEEVKALADSRVAADAIKLLDMYENYKNHNPP